MSNPVRVKICGVTNRQLMQEVGNAGAQYAGLVFFEKSPRSLTLNQARSIALEAPTGLVKVALVVNPSDSFLEHLTAEVPLDMIQLHGSEPPQRVTEIKQKTGLPVMKNRLILVPFIAKNMAKFLIGATHIRSICQ